MIYFRGSGEIVEESVINSKCSVRDFVRLLEAKKDKVYYVVLYYINMSDVSRIAGFFIRGLLIMLNNYMSLIFQERKDVKITRRTSLNSFVHKVEQSKRAYLTSR